jgi:hypothetical protein
VKVYGVKVAVMGNGVVREGILGEGWSGSGGGGWEFLGYLVFDFEKECAAFFGVGLDRPQGWGGRDREITGSGTKTSVLLLLSALCFCYVLTSATFLDVC